MKIEWSVAGITPVGSPDRAERAILGVIVAGRVFCQSRLFLWRGSIFRLFVCPGLILFLYFHCYVSIDVVLKSTVESCLLSKDEPLTPDIDGVMAL